MLENRTSRISPSITSSSREEDDPSFAKSCRNQPPEPVEPVEPEEPEESEESSQLPGIPTAKKWILTVSRH